MPLAGLVYLVLCLQYQLMYHICCTRVIQVNVIFWGVDVYHLFVVAKCPPNKYYIGNETNGTCIDCPMFTYKSNISVEDTNCTHICEGQDFPSDADILMTGKVWIIINNEQIKVEISAKLPFKATMDIVLFLK